MTAAEPKWLDDQAVVGLHDDLISEFGGSGVGVREHALGAALANAQWLYCYAEQPPSLFELAARYAFALAKDHPFYDGNKRTAVLAALLFLVRNGVVVVVPKDEGIAMTVGLAEGTVTEQVYADWLKSRSP